MCNSYEYEMTAEVIQTVQNHFDLVGTSYLDVRRGRNGPANVYPNYEAPVRLPRDVLRNCA